MAAAQQCDQALVAKFLLPHYDSANLLAQLLE
jgi:hypothetical protein